MPFWAGLWPLVFEFQKSQVSVPAGKRGDQHPCTPGLLPLLLHREWAQGAGERSGVCLRRLAPAALPPWGHPLVWGVLGPLGQHVPTAAADESSVTRLSAREKLCEEEAAAGTRKQTSVFKVSRSASSE